MQCKICNSTTHELVTRGIGQLEVLSCIAINLADLVKATKNG